MSKNSTLLLFGVLVIIVSFLGIPSSWKTIAFGILGVLIVIMALLLRKDIATGALCLHLTEEKQTDSYKQNGMLRNNNEENNTEKEDENEEEHENEHDKHTTEPQT